MKWEASFSIVLTKIGKFATTLGLNFRQDSGTISTVPAHQIGGQDMPNELVKVEMNHSLALTIAALFKRKAKRNRKLIARRIPGKLYEPVQCPDELVSIADAFYRIYQRDPDDSTTVIRFDLDTSPNGFQPSHTII